MYYKGNVFLAYFITLLIIYATSLFMLPNYNLFTKDLDLLGVNNVEYYYQGNLVNNQADINDDCSKVGRYEINDNIYQFISQTTVIGDSKYILYVGISQSVLFPNNEFLNAYTFISYEVEGREQDKDFYQQNINEMWDKIKNNVFNKVLSDYDDYSENFLGFSDILYEVDINNNIKKDKIYSVVNQQSLIGGLCKRVQSI